jgi:hypothetical protein
MPMSLKAQIRLLSMVDILGPLSAEELEDLAKRTPDTYLEQGDVLYTPQEGTERLFILKKGRVQVYEIDRSGEEITLCGRGRQRLRGDGPDRPEPFRALCEGHLPATVVSLRREELERLT